MLYEFKYGLETVQKWCLVKTRKFGRKIDCTVKIFLESILMETTGFFYLKFVKREKCVPAKLPGTHTKSALEGFISNLFQNLGTKINFSVSFMYIFGIKILESGQKS